MRFAFPVLGFIIGALLVADISSLWLRSLEFASGLPKISRPNPLSTTALAPTTEMTSPPVLAPAMKNQSAVEPQAAETPAKVTIAGEAPEESAKVQPVGQSAEVPAKAEASARAAPEEPAKIEPAARAARAQAPPAKKRLTRKDRIYLQDHPWALDPDSFIKYLVLGRVY